MRLSALARKIRRYEYETLEAGLSISNDPRGAIRKELKAYFTGASDIDQIAKVYTRDNKRIRAVADQVAVRLTGTGKEGGGRYAWIEGGKLQREYDIQMAMRSVDVAVGGHDSHIFENAWKNATNEEKARIAHDLNDFDWNAFWNEVYDDETGIFQEDAESRLAEILEDNIEGFTYDSGAAAASWLQENLGLYL